MFGDLGKIMKVVGQMKEKMPEMQQRLADSEYTAEVGGGLIEVTVNGKLALVNISIAPSVFSDGDDGQVDAAMLEDLIKAAVSAAQTKAANAAAEAMKELTGGMDIPGLSGMMP